MGVNGWWLSGGWWVVGKQGFVGGNWWVMGLVGWLNWWRAGWLVG